MKRIFAFLVMLMTVILLGTLMIPALAQDGDYPPGPEGAGEGGTIIDYYFGDDPSTFNPILASDSASLAVTGLFYPAIVGIDPVTGEPAPNLPGSVAESWEYDETSTILTVNLRQDLFWNDGTPITAADYVYATSAVRSGVTSSPRTSMFETLDDGTPAGGKIVSIEAADDYTVVITFTEADCTAFNDINDVSLVPAHIFSELYGTDYALMDEDPRALPTVTFGQWKDLEFAPAERYSVIADQSYPDTLLGFVSPGEYVAQNVPDTNVAVERLLAGDLTYGVVPANRQAEFRGNSDFQVFEADANSYVYIGFNLADPTNPQNGVDENGELIDQGLHPIFGDPAVRIALTHGIDIDGIVAGVLQGNGTRINTHTYPLNWVQAELEPRLFDPALASQLLEEAGWVDDDDDTATPRVCQGCLYATEVDAAFEGSPMSFTLITNAGNTIREQIGEVADQQWADIGVEVDFQAIDFGVVLEQTGAQTFDSYILGWGLGLPVNPSADGIFNVESDIVNDGFNSYSYYNEEYEELIDAGSTVAGCDVEERRAIYERIQTIFYEQQPVIFLYSGKTMAVAQNWVQGWNPVQWAAAHDNDAWVITPD